MTKPNLLKELKRFLRSEVVVLRKERNKEIKSGHLDNALRLDIQSDYASFILSEIECYEENGRWL